AGADADRPRLVARRDVAPREPRPLAAAAGENEDDAPRGLASRITIPSSGPAGRPRPPGPARDGGPPHPAPPHRSAAGGEGRPAWARAGPTRSPRPAPDSPGPRHGPAGPGPRPGRGGRG